ncbi:MAG: TlpA family protein disulfide reductase [Planctomycetota bacterium]|jgi:hypothetical protein
MRQVGHLNELHRKYFDKGLRIIAITAESLGTVESKMKDPAPEFWIGSDPGRATQSQFKAGKGGGIPHAYLIDATGKVVSDMHPASLKEQQIEELLKDAFDPSLRPDLHGSLKSLVKQYNSGQYGKAWAGAARLLEQGDRVVTADAEHLREKAEACAAFRRKLVESGVKAKDYLTVYDDLADLSKNFAGMEVATWAADMKKKLDGDPAVALEVKAWKALRKAQAKERKAEGKAKKLGPARTAYKRLVKKYEGTAAAQKAGEALRRIGG